MHVLHIFTLDRGDFGAYRVRRGHKLHALEIETIEDHRARCRPVLVHYGDASSAFTPSAAR